jgi:tRNA (guanine26-N2/guanine27-N2)-dimethyltransferase
MASTTASGKEVPEGYVLHTENTSHILLDANAAFLNPIQEFNRDLSVASIRVWSEEFNREKEARWRQKLERKQKSKETSHVVKRMKGAVPASTTPTGQCTNL